MRRVYLRGQANVLKRVLIHLGGFNLSLIMRRRFGKGTPRGWQGFSADALLMGLQFWIAILARCTGKHIAANAPIFTCRARHHCCPVRGAVTKLLPPRAASCCGTEPETTGAVPQHESATSDGKRVSNHYQKKTRIGRNSPEGKRVFEASFSTPTSVYAHWSSRSVIARFQQLCRRETCLP